MAYTNNELAQEFWLLTQGILQDSTVGTEEARVLKRWLEEHRSDASFDPFIAKLDKFLADGYVDRYESGALVDTIGTILRALRTK